MRKCVVGLVYQHVYVQLKRKKILEQFVITMQVRFTFLSDLHLLIFKSSETSSIVFRTHELFTGFQ